MPANNFSRIWSIPILLATLTLFGLLAALLGVGIWHGLAWTALCVPLAILCRHLFKR